MRIKEQLEVRKQWYYFIIDILVKTKELDKWKMPYYNTRHYANYRFDNDFNPVISLINFKETHIIRIIQEEDEFSYTSYLNTTMDNKIELVIITDNRERDKNKIENKIRKFIRDINSNNVLI